MSKADKMFEELGYEKTKNILGDDKYYNEKISVRIVFWEERKCVIVGGSDVTVYISMEGLKAINKKVEELGWNE